MSSRLGGSEPGRSPGFGQRGGPGILLVRKRFSRGRAIVPSAPIKGEAQPSYPFRYGRTPRRSKHSEKAFTDCRRPRPPRLIHKTPLCTPVKIPLPTRRARLSTTYQHIVNNLYPAEAQQVMENMKIFVVKMLITPPRLCVLLSATSTHRTHLCTGC